MKLATLFIFSNLLAILDMCHVTCTLTPLMQIVSTPILPSEETTVVPHGHIETTSEHVAKPIALEMDTHALAATPHGLIADRQKDGLAYMQEAEALSEREEYVHAAETFKLAAKAYNQAQDHGGESHAYKHAAYIYMNLKDIANKDESDLLAALAQYKHDWTGYYSYILQDYLSSYDWIMVKATIAVICGCLVLTFVFPFLTVQVLLARFSPLEPARLLLAVPVVLELRRSHLLEDSCRCIMALSPEEIQTLRITVRFVGEEAADYGGPTRELFTLLSREMMDPKHALFISRNDLERNYQPNPSKTDSQSLIYFRFFGRILALAISSSNRMSVKLTRAFYKQLLYQRVDWNDLQDYDPQLYAICKNVLVVHDLSALGLAFTTFIQSEDMNLCPEGAERPVTHKNKYEYVALMADMHLTLSISSQLDAFRQGFDEIAHPQVVDALDAPALELLVFGQPVISIDDWEKHTVYTGYNKKTKVVRWFWQTVRSLTPEQQARVLQLATGSVNVPGPGFSALVPKFTISKAGHSDKHLPTANTCFHQLHLPTYKSKKIQRAKLLAAIQDGAEGFGFM